MQVAKAGYRVSTGPVKFDDDWPGYFFRGDELPNDWLGFVAARLEELGEKGLSDRIVRHMCEMNKCLVRARSE